MNKKVFAFGKNWKAFLEDNSHQDLVKESAEYIRSFLGVQDLRGKTFLDIGCGSGLHSLAAHYLKADGVTSVDIDEDSVRCCEWLRDKNQTPHAWRVMHGSLLDQAFLQQIPRHDIVYCWGVAHHTGDMYRSLQYLADMTGPGGLLYIAIYNKVPGRRGSIFWYKIKQFYTDVPRLGKRLMEWIYVSYSVLLLLAHLQNPFKIMRDFKKKRGMSWKTDLIDWLGGYPYEYASAEEIFRFYRDRDFTLVNLKTTNYIGCNQFLFRKNG